MPLRQLNCWDDKESGTKIERRMGKLGSPCRQYQDGDAWQ